MNTTNIIFDDITCDIGPMFGVVCGDKPKYPMFSYERPAYLLWQAVYEGLISRGFTHQQAIYVLQSKQTRYWLDGQLGDALREAGLAFAQTCTKVK